MEELLLPYDDNWGSGAELIPYPALPRKAAVSKSVQKRREKQAKSFQKLVDSTIVLGRTSLPGRTARLQSMQRRQAEAVRWPEEQPEQGSAANSVTRKKGKAHKKDQKKLAVTDQVIPAVEDHIAEPASKRRAPVEQAAGSPSQQLPSKTAAKHPLKWKKQTTGQLAASITEAEQASGGVPKKAKKWSRAQEPADSRTEPVPGGQSEHRQKLPGKKQKSASNQQGTAPRETDMHPSSMPAAAPPSSRRERAEAAAQKRGLLAASVDRAAEVRERMQPAEADGHRPDKSSAMRKRRKRQAGAVPSPEERLAAEQNCCQPDESPAKKKSKKSGQHADAVPSPEATREAEQNCRQSGESPAKKKHRRSSQQAAAVPSPEEEPREAEQDCRKQEGQGLGKSSSGHSRKKEPGAPKATALHSGQHLQPSPSLLDKMATRLHGSRFRWLNETLYTSTGDTAFALMQDQPELFDQYHKGFQQQTQNWPQQPVDVAIGWLRKLPSSWRVADFGCGDAALALAVDQKVACLDLVATVPGVIAGNMKDTPLETGSMDVAVFCLALMGTDYPAFLREAARVVKPGGRLWIAEVRSRFAGETGEDFRPFLAALRGLGFELVEEDASNKMFVVFQLRKTLGTGDVPESIAPWPELKPCLYKRR